ncbi:putative AlkP superfamily pyrophosphatase or phosphodiesterase [Saccharopolyspora erythraea NRRL 2338]|uniref:Type I phosphodiesterase/nucleotide pyrophosphatase n=2 Tax=Saccharopolyspora erythraea TaxID=1836 RepID=A4FNB3_SACEN|nr:nucleotide pyrophosphatase/phosphodiesterase family protein [Saccharopolyspora erythraea]PFG99177.1 putative AlkP superfamily pyrophosphatase or phosphodiesterase [Saccharopolyspora erythraea NRRL 2338]QRK89126.1 alkaline phosphatase family protein [Saccharopolyspora erythraea]CAM05538.1 type I phosphodiesterase/nucleotide pyrophosphatase [Saccharopolyspora erythraea NRRL 2338]
MDWIVAPDHDGRALPDVLPSLLAAMGTPGFTDTVGFPACRNAAVLLVDGLGWDLLRAYAADAPFLASLATGNPVKVGFPTTTATSITSLGTGSLAGEHGVVGYTFAEPSGGLLHPLSWGTHSSPNASASRRSLLQDWPPESAQPRATVLERAVEAGVDVRIAVPREFKGTGLTRAALRGGEFRGVGAMGDLAAELLTALAVPGPALCYGYHGHLDGLGHGHGPGSLPWRMQLSQIDALVANLASKLPESAVLAVVADHGMVAVDPEDTLDADTEPALQHGVRLIGGEGRARHVYAEPGAGGDVLAAWREAIGCRGVVVTGEQAIDDGWFGPVISGPVRPRIGDVIAVMRESAVVRSAVEPAESSLRGQHGSMTAAEQYVPLLVAQG